MDMKFAPSALDSTQEMLEMLTMNYHSYSLRCPCQVLKMKKQNSKTRNTNVGSATKRCFPFSSKIVYHWILGVVLFKNINFLERFCLVYKAWQNFRNSQFCLYILCHLDTCES